MDTTSLSSLLKGGGISRQVPRMQFWAICLCDPSLYARIDLENWQYMHTYRQKTEKRIDFVVTFYAYMSICSNKTQFSSDLGQRDTHPKFLRRKKFALRHT